MERVQQGQGFMDVLLDHVIALLYKAVDHSLETNEGLRNLFNLPPGQDGDEAVEETRPRVPFQASFRQSIFILLYFILDILGGFIQV